MPLVCRWCDGREDYPVCPACMGEGIERCTNCGHGAHLLDDQGNPFCDKQCHDVWHEAQPPRDDETKEAA